VRVCVHMYACEFVYVCVCVFVYLCVCVLVFECVCVRSCIQSPVHTRLLASDLQIALCCSLPVLGTTGLLEFDWSGHPSLQKFNKMAVTSARSCYCAAYYRTYTVICHVGFV